MCQYFDIIYKINYTDSNNYTVSKNTEKIFFVKRNSKKGCKVGRKNIYIPFEKRCKMVRRKSGDSKRFRIFLEKDRLDVNLHPDAHMLPNAVMKKDKSSETLEMNIM